MDGAGQLLCLSAPIGHLIRRRKLANQFFRFVDLYKFDVEVVRFSFRKFRNSIYPRVLK